MLRRLLSHFLVFLAVFALVSTTFIWIVDATILTPSKLVPALRKGGVPQALATAIPDIATKDTKDSTPQELADMKSKISKVATAEYIDKKIDLIANTVIGYARGDVKVPTIDLTDFPAKLKASGVDVGSDIDSKFAAPIALNDKGTLDAIPKAYNQLKLAKTLGVVVFVVLLGVEWLVAEKGKKLRRVGRIFLHTGIWFMLFWLAVVEIPATLLPNLKDKLKPDASVSGLIDALTKSVQALLGSYLLLFSVACLGLALVFYVLRVLWPKAAQPAQTPTPTPIPTKVLATPTPATKQAARKPKNPRQ